VVDPFADFWNAKESSREEQNRWKQGDEEDNNNGKNRIRKRTTNGRYPWHHFSDVDRMLDSIARSMEIMFKSKLWLASI
jgi:hypothetical protein